MIKYIDADKLIELIYAEKEYLSKRREYGAEHILMHHFYPLVDELSAADVVEVRHGRWLQP